MAQYKDNQSQFNTAKPGVVKQAVQKVKDATKPVPQVEHKPNPELEAKNRQSFF